MVQSGHQTSKLNLLGTRFMQTSGSLHAWWWLGQDHHPTESARVREGVVVPPWPGLCIAMVFMRAFEWDLITPMPGANVARVMWSLLKKHKDVVEQYIGTRVWSKAAAWPVGLEYISSCTHRKHVPCRMSSKTVLQQELCARVGEHWWLGLISSRCTGRTQFTQMITGC